MPYGTSLKEPMCVLMVDDDPALATLVRRALERRGHRTIHVTTGDEAMARLAEDRIDIISLDHTLAAETGLDILDRLGPRSIRPPIVYVTGSLDARLAIEAMKRGADDYVVKETAEDFFHLLIAALEQALERWRLKRENERDQELIRIARDRAEVLLREVNHRVANSLSLVAAMVRMQAAALGDPQARSALEETQSRISAVAGVHRHLYTSENVGEVDLGAYLGHLAAELGESFGGSDARHRIVCRLEPITIKTDKAVSLGVMVGELMTNAFKYAYGQGEAGSIRLTADRGEDGRVRVAVEDDGVGWDGGGPVQGTGLGGKVLKAMARNLDAQLLYQPMQKGTRAEILFSAA